MTFQDSHQHHKQLVWHIEMQTSKITLAFLTDYIHVCYFGRDEQMVGLDGKKKNKKKTNKQKMWSVDEMQHKSQF